MSDVSPLTGGEPESSRVLIADDHPLYRGALKQMISQRSNLQVVGEAADGQEALEFCRRLLPDLVLMDVRMPQMDGLAATRAIKKEFPHTIVLILTSFDDPNYLLEALRSGAAGYALKYVSAQQLTDVIQRALRGEFPLDQELTKGLLLHLVDEMNEEQLADPPGRGRPLEKRTEPAVLESLTPREIEVLKLLAQGQSNQEIAQSLLISVSTVKKHVRQIIAKLGVSDRTQAAIQAIKLGLLPG